MRLKVLNNHDDLAADRGGAEGAARPSRRDVLKYSAAAAVSAFLAGCSSDEREAFFQKRFKELGPSDVGRVLARLEEQHSREFGKAVSVGAEPALAGVVYGYGLDLSRCVGCRRCVYACVEENNQSRDPQVQWIKVLSMDKEHGVDVMHADAYYDPAAVPEEDKFYFPVACQQCRNPPCVKACPVQATWQEPDGIVVIDYNWCIGCRCCMAACPYGARRFNWGTPTLPPDQLNPHTHYLGNRPRPRGVVEKCTFCIQRVRQKDGRYPACVEACPVGARKFGNLLDPDSEIRHILREKRVFIFKEELNTEPKFFYFYAT
jgi:molybdopterin-containing oxidoreductase family iron-sulfur binding subunit